MVILKFAMLAIIFILSIYTGNLLSNTYKNRLNELKEMKKALQFFETKIRYTYEPIPEIFLEIANTTNENISNIFRIAADKMKKVKASISWEEALEESKNNFKKEDIEVIKGLSKLLGQTDLEGQVSQIELTDNFLDVQIENAKNEYLKNEKLYKTLRYSCRSSCCNNFSLMCL